MRETSALQKWQLAAAILEQFDALRRENPELAEAVLKDLGTMLGNVRVAVHSSNTETAEAMGQIVKVYQDNGNTGLTKEELAEKSGVSSHTIHTLIYRSAKEKFESEPDPRNRRRNLLRLRDCPPRVAASSTEG